MTLKRLALAAVLLPSILTAPALAQADDAEEREEIRVLPIRHAHVTHAFEVLNEFVGDAVIYADQRSNSLIVNAIPSVHQRIKALVGMVDVAVEEEVVDDSSVQAFPLMHTHADGNLTGTLMSILGSRGLRVANDPFSNQIIARGSKVTLAELGRVIQSIDKPRADAEAAGTGQLQVRLLWLVDKLGEQGRLIPADLNPVLAELKGLGIEGLRLAAQTVVRATTGRPFNTRFAAVLQAPWDVQFEGMAGTDAAVRQIDLQIEARPNDGPGGVDLHTTIVTVTGHYVVLSANPIEGLQSVFVVQVTDVAKP
jgi:hypothetical protein